MGSDMVVALGRATVEGRTLFGVNATLPETQGLALVREPGRAFAPGETVPAGGLRLTQARQTFTVVGCRPAGRWGYLHGLNEHGVAAATTSVRTRLTGSAVGLAGTDLVRLALERATGARQAVDFMTDVIARHGQGDSDSDNAFLVADGREAFVLESAGRFWAEQVVGSVRAASDTCQLRQDWDRIARGLSDVAIEQGWWPANGSKIDFAGAIGVEHGDNAAALRRWGRATFLLEQQSGLIDGPFLRRVLADHNTAPADDVGLRPPGAAMSLCRHGAEPDDQATSASMIVATGLPGSLPVAWCCFGPPCLGTWFPLLPVGELPAVFQGEGGCAVWRRAQRLADEARRSRDRAEAIREAAAGLQEQFDQQARELLAEAALLRQQGEEARLQRLANSLMQHQVERWEDVMDELVPPPWRPARAIHGSPHEYVTAGD